MQNSNVVSISFSRYFLAAWLLLTLVAGCISIRNFNLPHPQTYMTFDEYAYGALAYQFSDTGEYSGRKVFPDGLYHNGDRCLGHPMLLPYLEAAAINVMGFSRAALRTPSMLLFLASSLMLLHIWSRSGMSEFQGIGLMATFLLSPWMIYAATTARPEMLSGFLVLAACWAGWRFRNHPWLGFVLAGMLGGMATYNHPTYLGVACLPFLFALKCGKVPIKVTNVGKAALLYGGGAALMVGVLFAIFILPYLPQWKEQFLDNVAQKENPLYSQSVRGVGWVQQLYLLKARFSTFGMPYLNWYVAGVLLCPLLLRWTPYFLAGSLWLVGFMVFVGGKTDVYMHYCVQFAVGIPVLVLLLGPPRFRWEKLGVACWLALALVAVQVPWNAWRVTAQNRWSQEFQIRESGIAAALKSLDGKFRVSGPLEVAFPALEKGHRYFQPDAVWAESTERSERRKKLISEQLDYRVSQDGKINNVVH